VKRYRYQILVKVPGGKPVITWMVFDSLKQTHDWIEEYETYEGQYTFQKFTGSVPDHVLTESAETIEPKSDPLTPAATLLIKLGSIAVHAEEFMSSDGHEFDAVILRGLLDDPEVQAWRIEMDAMAFLPKKRQ